MLPALGKPLCVRVMDRLYRIGIKKYTVILGEQEGTVANYLNSRWHREPDIEFILKSESQPMGKVLSSIAMQQTQPMIIAGYNSFTHEHFPARLRKYHDLSPADLILAGATNSLSRSDTQTFARIDLPGTGEVGYTTTPRQAAEVVTAINPEMSPAHLNLYLTNIAACGTTFIEFLQKLTPEDVRCNTLMDIFAAYVRKGHTARLARSGWVMQVQEDRDLITLNRHLLDEQMDAHILSEVPYTVKIIEPVRIDPGVSVGQGATIGPHVYLESGSSVGREAVVKNSIVLGRATVKGHETVKDSIISTRERIQL